MQTKFLLPVNSSLNPLTLPVRLSQSIPVPLSPLKVNMLSHMLFTASESFSGLQFEDMTVVFYDLFHVQMLKLHTFFFTKWSFFVWKLDKKQVFEAWIQHACRKVWMNVTYCINLGHKCVLVLQVHREGHISVELEATTGMTQMCICVCEISW